MPESAIARVKAIQITLGVIDTETAENDGVVHRHRLRQRKDLEKELDLANAVVNDYASGKISAEYRREAMEYLRMFKMCKSDTSATGSVDESLISMSGAQCHRRYRKRSDLDSLT